MTILFFIIALGSMPVMQFFNSPDNDNTFPVDTVYVLDETGLGINDFSALKEQNKKYKDVTFSPVTELKDLSSEEMQLVISKPADTFMIQFIASEEDGISEDDITKATPDFNEIFYKERMKALDITPEQDAVMQAKAESEITILSAEGTVDEKTEAVSQNQYYSFLFIIVLVVFLIAFSAETVSSSIALEKSNKLVESLMLCVKPSTLISGKVIGGLLTVILQVGIIIAGLFASAYLSMEIYNLDAPMLPKQMQDFLSQIEGHSWISLFIVFLFLLAGVVFFATLAGLFGAAVSSMEDLASGMQAYNILMILGAYSGIGISMMKLLGEQYNWVEKLLCFVPICAPFIVPINLLSGQISVLFALLSLLVQIGFILLLGAFVFRIYRAMLLYKGERLKIKSIIRLSKERTENQ